MPSLSFFLRSSTTLVSALSLFSATSLAKPLNYRDDSLPAIKYKLQKDYFEGNFFDNFDFWDKGDPTHGFVTYVDRPTAANYKGKVAGSNQQPLINSGDSAPVLMHVDYTSTYDGDAPVRQYDVEEQPAINGVGRPSVRIESVDRYTNALIVVDVSHMPGGICGVWPAFWTLGDNWPNNGEIDILEGFNLQTTNFAAMHVNQQCEATNNPFQTGSVVVGDSYSENDCNTYFKQGKNNAGVDAINYTGCKISDGPSNSFGTDFNNNGGGVYAMEWTDEHIKVWFFARSEISGELVNKKSGLFGSSPDTSKWGLPFAYLGDKCNIKNNFREHRIIFDTTFCGDAAGNDYVWQNLGCQAKTKYPKCNNYVADNPAAFKNAYWHVEKLKVFQQDDGKSTSTSSSSSMSSTTSTIQTSSSTIFSSSSASVSTTVSSSSSTSTSSGSSSSGTSTSSGSSSSATSSSTMSGSSSATSASSTSSASQTSSSSMITSATPSTESTSSTRQSSETTSSFRSSTTSSDATTTSSVTGSQTTSSTSSGTTTASNSGTVTTSGSTTGSSSLTTSSESSTSGISTSGSTSGVSSSGISSSGSVTSGGSSSTVSTTTGSAKPTSTGTQSGYTWSDWVVSSTKSTTPTTTNKGGAFYGTNSWAQWQGPSTTKPVYTTCITQGAKTSCYECDKDEGSPVTGDWAGWSETSKPVKPTSTAATWSDWQKSSDPVKPTSSGAYSEWQDPKNSVKTTGTGTWTQWNDGKSPLPTIVITVNTWQSTGGASPQPVTSPAYNSWAQPSSGVPIAALPNTNTYASWNGVAPTGAKPDAVSSWSGVAQGTGTPVSPATGTGSWAPVKSFTGSASKFSATFGIIAGALLAGIMLL